MAEAHAITGLDYYREEKYDEYTTTRVFQALREAGATLEVAEKAMNVMENRGILFRERKKK